MPYDSYFAAISFTIAIIQLFYAYGKSHMSTVI